MEAFSPLFDITIPHAIPGFELEDAEKMEELWPAGYDAAREILQRFVSQKHRVGQLDGSPLNKGGINVLGKGAMAGKGKGETRIGRYNQDRDMADRDSSSRVSPYLASGVISIRELIRETLRFLGGEKVDTSKENGPSFWVSELGQFPGTLNGSYLICLSLARFLYTCACGLSACLHGETLPGEVRRHQMGSRPSQV